ncbi:histidinol phosphate phosphatase domain-containing protein [Salinicoccus sesuvii]|uniref:Histidinol-phosphatase n=1 Tax=Salinicoccus sesuvii TaxID=868281 RepID=A0ABV7N652_9STAP
MKVDYHVHLEEGPYSTGWLSRTSQSLSYFMDDQSHSYEWMETLESRLHTRVNDGCYSEAWLDLYLERASQLGLKEVGIVDHLYRFHDATSYYEKYIYMADDALGEMQKRWLHQVATMPSLEAFVSFIESQKEKWQARGINLKLGLEADFFPGGKDELRALIADHPWDYVIGSVHFVEGWGFDNPETVDVFKERDLIELYQLHTSYVCQAIESGLFDIIAHLDNLKLFSYRPDEGLLETYYEKVASSLKAHNVASEVNTGLSYRYPIKEACPSPRYLKLLQAHGVPLTLSSDAHYPDDLGTNLDWAQKMLMINGYEAISTFTKRQRVQVPIAHNNYV